MTDPIEQRRQVREALAAEGAKLDELRARTDANGYYPIPIEQRIQQAIEAGDLDSLIRLVQERAGSR